MALPENIRFLQVLVAWSAACSTLGQSLDMEFEIIQINWKERRRIGADSSPIDQGAGIYAAYGDHDIYGRDVLLYIGKTVNFDIRTRQHLDGILSKVNNLSIAFGRIISHGLENEFDAIDVAEQILIASLKPAYNRQSIYMLGDNPMKQGYLVQNLDERGSLPLEVTNYWWLPKEITGLG